MSNSRKDSQQFMRVLHVGIHGDRPGGMAQVVNQYLAWNFDGVQVSAASSTRFAHDPLAPLLSLMVFFRLIVFRMRSREGVVVFHLSERGSFVREGGLLVFASVIGIQTVAHLHGAQFAQFAKRSPRLVRFVLRRPEAVGVLSQQSLEVVLGLVSAKTRVKLVPNGVQLPKPDSLKDKQNIVLFGGEIGARKGVDLLIAAWRTVAPSDGSWRLLLVGPVTEFSEELQGLLGAEVLGPRSHEEILQLLSRARIAVLPSRNEALPMFLLEAMAASCSLVATNVGQIESICGKDNGILIPPGEVEPLAGALQTLMSLDSDELSALGRESRRRVESGYSGSTARKNILELWMSAVKGKH